MPTLNAIFRLTNQYTPVVEKIYSSTRRTTDSIDQASRSTDSFNARLRSSESTASRFATRITGLAAAFLSLKTAEAAMGISDTYTNTNARLSLITDNLLQQKQLQQEIYAAAERSRGNYSDMADTVAKMGIIAGEQFGSNQNIVKFTETMQKMFKVGGTSIQEQAGAWLQLQQAIGLGKLQGQDLKILSEDAPLVEKALAKYLGTSTGMIKKMGSDGEITSQVLINSILKYSKTVDEQVSGMAYTWGDYWNEIKTKATEAFGSVFENESGALNSQGFHTFINSIVSSFSALANAANGLLSAVSGVSQFFSDNWGLIQPIIMGLVAALIAYNSVLLAYNIAQGVSAGLTTMATVASIAHGAAVTDEMVATTGLTGAQLAFNASLYACPITWIVLGIIAVITALYLVVAIINKLTGQSISATGLIAGAVLWLGALVLNIAIGVYNAIIQAAWGAFVEPFLSIMEWVLNVANGGFNSFGDAVANLIGQIISWFVSLGEIVTKVIDAIFGKNWTAGLESFKSALTNYGKNEKGITLNKTAPAIQNRIDMTNAFGTGYSWGKGIESSIASKFSLGGAASAPTGTAGDPTTVKGTGSGGTMSVNIADQDLQYLRDLAEKDYIAKFSTATLAPSIKVQIAGTGNADSDKQLGDRISAILREGIATAAEGNYA